MSSRSDILELWGVPTSRESRAVLAGAGVFVTTVVAGGIALVKPFTAASRPFLRDVIFYMVAVFLTFVVLYVGRIRLGEALGERYGSWGWWEQPGGNGGSLGVMWQPGGAVTPPITPPSQVTWGSTCSMCSPWCSAPGSTGGSGGTGWPLPGPGSQVRTAQPGWDPQPQLCVPFHCPCPLLFPTEMPTDIEEPEASSTNSGDYGMLFPVGSGLALLRPQGSQSPPGCCRWD